MARAEPAPYETPAFILERPALPESEAASPARSLGMRDAIQIAVKNNLGIVLSRQVFEGSTYGIERAQGGFEPALSASVTHRFSRTPPSTLLDASNPDLLVTLEADEWRAGYQQRTALGTTLGLDFANSRINSSLLSALAPLLYRSELQLRLTQPLLRGFAFDTDIPRADVLRARFASERAKQDVLATLLVTVRDTEQAYWDVFQALKTYEVQRRSLELAREQLHLTRRQIDAGVRPPSDLINAEATVAQRELNLIQAQGTGAQATDQLRTLLNLPAEQWSEPLLPVDAPAFQPLQVSFDEALRTALERRPEIEQRAIDLSRAALDVRAARAARLPGLDATVAYGLIGQRAEYGSTLDQLLSADARAWSAGLSFSWTPFNEAASAEYEARRVGEQAARTGLEQQRLALRLELRTALRSLETAERAVAAAAKFRRLAEQSLDAEQRKFLNGTSDNFYIAQRQNDLASAQLAELAAVVQHRRAATSLRAAMGVLLEQHDIELEVE